MAASPQQIPKVPSRISLQVPLPGDRCHQGRRGRGAGPPQDGGVRAGAEAGAEAHRRPRRGPRRHPAAAQVTRPRRGRSGLSAAPPPLRGVTLRGRPGRGGRAAPRRAAPPGLGGAAGAAARPCVLCSERSTGRLFPSRGTLERSWMLSCRCRPGRLSWCPAPVRSSVATSLL